MSEKWDTENLFCQSGAGVDLRHNFIVKSHLYVYRYSLTAVFLYRLRLIS